MADFENDLAALFQAAEAPALGERLAGRALAQIDREDRQRGLILTAGSVFGVGAAGLAIARSGAVTAARELIAEAFATAHPHVAPNLLWIAAAVALAVYGAATLRPGRAL